MGSRTKKAIVAESVRESLHSWCKRVKRKSKRESSLHSHTVRSVCSLDTSTIHEGDEITVASGTLSRSSSIESMNQTTVTSIGQLEQLEAALDLSSHPKNDFSFRMDEYLNESLQVSTSHAMSGEEDPEIARESNSGGETLQDLFRKT